ncbi:putative tRNA pseudouridine synthase Pus10 isoform X1 [Brienomyrus brachyistius]|uniref:putative tRNA pseudouridine synthase Pus10 isoform X1 n=1 Tax=Brienomyrus brachyistius TaxID=42636 RepID=UPI0020B274E3|nr:putative tRNA pseudouridine synthase Pus10 isoform X1 [Brienomyrus brachyistius]
MLPLKDKDRPIAVALLGAGCCPRCILRFCCVSLQSAYRQPHEDILLELQRFIHAKVADESCGTAEEIPTDSPPCKKVRVETEQGGELPEGGEEISVVEGKSKICVVCLGVLQDFCNKDFAKKVAETVTSEKYEFDSLVLSVSLPAQLSVREHSAWLLIKTKVREKGLCLGKDDIIQVKEAFKWILQSLLSQQLGVPVVSKSPLEVSVGFTHPETDGDCHFLAAACSGCFKPAKNKLVLYTAAHVCRSRSVWVNPRSVAAESLVSCEHAQGSGPGRAGSGRGGFDRSRARAAPRNHILAARRHVSRNTRQSRLICSVPFPLLDAAAPKSLFTRMAVAKALERISEESFRRKFPCPPCPPATKCTVQEVQCLHAPVFVAGRYNKFSRTLPQTPWVIDGERRMESSVEELITTPLLASFQAEGFNFSSSGREDVDVRTLGNGRPFAVELLNPHRTRFSPAEVRKIQEAINKSSDKIGVRDLQIVTRDAVGHMKEGEEEKTKSYSALIWTHKAIEEQDLEFINDIKDLSIAQKTPLRVLHRRPLAVRQRVIHTMATRFRDNHHFYLQLRTQAGTYIKEFVHGDFGRTKPSLGDLMKMETDILELDVESVDVDWPPVVTDPGSGENPDLPGSPQHGGTP